MRTRVLAVVLATLTLPFAGCGGGGGGGNVTGGSSTSRTPTRSIVTQQGWQLEPEQFTAVDITITGTGSGTADATVEWTFATDDVDIYVAQTTCSTTMFANDLCSYVTKADGIVKPERVSWSVTGGTNYRVFVLNWGPARESGTIEVGLTQ